ncbi:MAG: hypothetical protein JWR63_3727 [Conexibacter sp.]|nr:hypothetical protein [Conexibacter sp.]
MVRAAQSRGKGKGPLPLSRTSGNTLSENAHRERVALGRFRIAVRPTDAPQGASSRLYGLSRERKTPAGARESDEALHRTRTDDPFLTMERGSVHQVPKGLERPMNGGHDGLHGTERIGRRAPETPHEGRSYQPSRSRSRSWIRGDDALALETFAPRLPDEDEDPVGVRPHLDVEPSHYVVEIGVPDVAVTGSSLSPMNEWGVALRIRGQDEAGSNCVAHEFELSASPRR